MEIDVAPDYEALSHKAAALIADAVKDNPRLSLCLATGSTPTRTYELLVGHKTSAPELYNQVRIVKLDEWGGLAMDNPATCEAYLQRHVLNPLGIDAQRYVAFHSDPSSPDAECERIQSLLNESGPIDLCILGLGANGHLGFNEPAEWLMPFPHAAALTETTLRHPMAQQAETTIGYGLTLGMADILHSRQILLLVNGDHKRPLLTQLLAGEITTHFPASLLWLHPNVTILCDKEAHPD